MDTTNDDGKYYDPPPTARRYAFFRGIQLPPVLPQDHKILSSSPREKPRQAGPGRGRDVSRRNLIQGRIAKSRRPLPLRARKAKLVTMCRQAGVRNAAGLVNARG